MYWQASNLTNPMITPETVSPPRFARETAVSPWEISSTGKECGEVGRIVVRWDGAGLCAEREDTSRGHYRRRCLRR